MHGSSRMAVVAWPNTLALPQRRDEARRVFAYKTEIASTNHEAPAMGGGARDVKRKALHLFRAGRVRTSGLIVGGSGYKCSAQSRLGRTDNCFARHLQQAVAEKGRLCR